MVYRRVFPFVIPCISPTQTHPSQKSQQKPSTPHHPEAPWAFNGRPDPSISHPRGGWGSESQVRTGSPKPLIQSGVKSWRSNLVNLRAQIFQAGLNQLRSPTGRWISVDTSHTEAGLSFDYLQIDLNTGVPLLRYMTHPWGSVIVGVVKKVEPCAVDVRHCWDLIMAHQP